MKQLDKWQREIEQLSNYAEDATNKKLFKYYRKALIDIKKEMKVFMENYELLSFAQRLDVERLFENAKAIDKILNEIYKEVNGAIGEFARGQVERGYYGTWYAMEGAHNVQLDMNMLPERYIKQLVHHPVKGKVFSRRLYQQTNQLAKEVNAALLNAARTGQGYEIVAKNVSQMTEASYKRALRIARTEGGRVQSTAKQRSYVEAKKKGLDLQKKWLSTLDKKTRHSHQDLDGQTVDIEDKFVSKNGHAADGPRLFGVAEEDIHCRCTTITIVNGIAPEIRRENINKSEFPYRSYDEWYNNKKGTPKPTEQLSLRFTDKIKGNMPTEHQTILEDILNKAPEEVRNLWSRLQNDFVTVDATSQKSYYLHGQGVSFNHKIDSENEGSTRLDGSKILGKENNATFFHEYGHHIDGLLGRYEVIKARGKIGRKWHTYEMKVHRDRSYDLELSKSLRAEVKEIMKRYDVNDIKDLTTILKGESEKKYPYGFSGVSDIFSGLTQGLYSFGWEHSRSYWKTKNHDMLSSEAFAHMFQAYTMQGQSHDFMKEIFPKTYDKVINFIKEEANR